MIVGVAPVLLSAVAAVVPVAAIFPEPVFVNVLLAAGLAIAVAVPFVAVAVRGPEFVRVYPVVPVD